MTKQIPHEIIDRASEWFIEMRETNVSDSKREAFTEWLRSSPAHVQAYLEVAGIWGDTSQVSKDFPVDVAVAATNVVALEKGDSVPRTTESQDPSAALPRAAAEPSSTRAMRMPLAIAATVLMLIGVAGWFYLQRGVYRSEIGEQRVLTLEDGSVVRLNSRSKVRVQLTPRERNIELLEGQAHFQVAKDASRPFTVHTHDITARAVGTQFDVYRRETGSTVTVIKGRVAVAPDTAFVLTPRGSPEIPEQPRISADVPVEAGTQGDGTGPALRSQDSELLLTAGQQATVTSTGALQLQPEANIAAATGWLQQELIFTGEPLSTVIAEFNRYTRRTIVLDDPTLAQSKINAAFNTTNPRGLLLYLSRMDGVTINETQHEIHVSRREPQN